MPTPKALHSKNTPRWGTPQWVIEAARRLMGGIHLDPASSEEFNFYVKALMIYRQQDNGLAPECEWAGNVFLNPPGGLVNEFWNKLCENYWNGNVEKAFWVGFSVEQLCTLGSEKDHPMDFSLVILRKRLSFNQQIDTPILAMPKDIGSIPDDKLVVVKTTDGSTGLREIVGYEPSKIVQGNSPAHGNYLCALGCDPREFEKIFGQYGKIHHGKHALDISKLKV